MNISKKQLLYGTGLLLTGLLTGWLLFSGSPADNDHSAHNLQNQHEIEQHVQDSHTDENGEIVWTCSMHLQIRESEPGNWPICVMQLMPSRSQGREEDEDNYPMVMTASAALHAGIQTTPVIRAVPQKNLDLPGRIRVDERRITRVTAHFPGRVRKLNVNFTGAMIRKGEPMATIFSPELITAQRELLEAARQKEHKPRLYESARQKFRLWEFTDEKIQEIEESGNVHSVTEILSQFNGYI